MTDRYDYARDRDIADQAVAIRDKRANDKLAAEAEKLVAAFLGLKWRERRVDGGVDLDYRGWTLDVKWSPLVPYRPGTKTRAFYARLGVPAWKPLRAAIYVAVNGSIRPYRNASGVGIAATDDDAMKIYGWAFQGEVRAAPKRSFGYTNHRGEPALLHVVELHELHSREVLRALPAFDPTRRRDDALSEAFEAVPPAWRY